ncbi:hypothetical protein [Oceanobacillus jeddahense]|nr:hypothetical protein [Oceanobacillus jeddahense]
MSRSTNTEWYENTKEALMLFQILILISISDAFERMKQIVGISIEIIK